MSRAQLRQGLRAFGFGLLPCLALSCIVVLLGWTTVPRVSPPVGAPTPENLEQRAAELREQLPSSFRVKVAPPFVLIAETSDERATELAKEVEATAAVATDMLFARHPHTVTDVWVFADTQSFRTGVRERLGDWPRTLRGYYSPSRRAVIVNLEAGEHVLRHEVIHPFMAANFPDAPAWVDEGVASLFEQTQHTHAGMAFLPDERLPRMRALIGEHKLPSIAAFTAGTDDDFYGNPTHTSYAQARYVMMFLESRGWLYRFLRRLERHYAIDSTGLQTLLDVSDSDTSGAFELHWQAYLSSLSAR